MPRPSNGLTKQHEKQHEDMKRQMALPRWRRVSQGSIADEVYEAMTRSLMTSLRADVARQGMKFEDFLEQQGGEQQFNMMMMLHTREMLVQGYALDAVFRHEGSSSPTTTSPGVHRDGRWSRPIPKLMRSQLEDSGRGFVLREAAERLRANKWLVEHAVIKDLPEPASEAAPAAPRRRRRAAPRPHSRRKRSAEPASRARGCIWGSQPLSIAPSIRFNFCAALKPATEAVLVRRPIATIPQLSLSIVLCPGLALFPAGFFPNKLRNEPRFEAVLSESRKKVVAGVRTKIAVSDSVVA